MERFTFFYRSASPFSQWHPARFTVAGVTFQSAEQYMMYGKAKLFGDEQTAWRMMRTASPAEQKALGREVAGFDRELWEARCRSIVYDGNYAKFTQNEPLLGALLATRGTTLVEASPTDRIWGVGLAEGDPAILQRATWRGKNWLGEVLTALREAIIEERSLRNASGSLPEPPFHGKGAL